MKLPRYLLILLILGATACKTPKAIYAYESETLKIEQLTENTFLHVSYLDTESFGKVACNGLVVIDKGEAILFDAPVSKADASELLNWITNTLKSTPKGIVATHFHLDCLGSLEEFHEREIPSYANNRTIALAKANNRTVPQYGFADSLTLKVGTKRVVSEYLGEGHTKDNVVGYFPSEKVLFGGCLIKETGAGKGNLEDANVEAWPGTVARVKAKYGDADIIIPGHGKTGGQELLTYTIELFQKE